MVNNDPPSLGGTGAVRNAPAPWVPYTRAGCDVGNVGVANTVLENNNSIIFKTGTSSVFATDPTGDMTKVFGEGSPEWNEGKDSQLAPAGTAARAKAQTDFVGIAIHCATPAAASATRTRRTPRPDDSLPDEARRLRRLQGALRREVRRTRRSTTAARASTTRTGSRSPTSSTSAASRASTGCSRRTRSARSRRCRRPASRSRSATSPTRTTGTASPARSTTPTGPARPATSSSSRTTTRRSRDFFARLQSDGITKDNSLFVVTVEEGDHFAGTAPDDPRATASPTPCTYSNGHVTEVNGDLKRLVATYNASHGTSRDDELQRPLATWRRTSTSPAIRPGTPPTARTLEKAMSDMTVTNPLLGPAAEAVRRDGRSGRGEVTPHGHGRPGADADVHAVRPGRLLPQRVRRRDAVRRATTSNCVFLPNDGAPNQTFAWNHGGIQPEIAHDLDRLGRARASRRRAETDKVLDRPHRHPADDALAARAEGRLRVRRPRRHRVPEGRRRAEVARRQGRSRISARCTSRSTRRSAHFSMNTLCASTGALASNTPGDTTYTNTETALAVARRPARHARERDPPGALERGVQRPEDRREAGEGLDRSRARATSTRPPRCAASSRRARTRRSSRRSTTSW